jgi:hypothetical protein
MVDDVTAMQSPSVLATFEPGFSPSSIAVDQTNVYVPNSGDGSVIAIALAGGQPTTLASGQTSPVGAAVSGSDLYWTNAGTAGNGHSDGSVMKLSLKDDGGAPVTLATSQQSPGPLAASAKSLYWGTSNAIVTLKLP